MSAGQCDMRQRNWDGWVLDYGVVFCDTQKWLSCLYSATQINTISDTINEQPEACPASCIESFSHVLDAPYNVPQTSARVIQRASSPIDCQTRLPLEVPTQ